MLHTPNVVSRRLQHTLQCKRRTATDPIEHAVLPCEHWLRIALWSTTSLITGEKHSGCLVVGLQWKTMTHLDISDGRYRYRLLVKQVQRETAFVN